MFRVMHLGPPTLWSSHIKPPNLQRLTFKNCLCTTLVIPISVCYSLKLFSVTTSYLRVVHLTSKSSIGF